MVFIIYRVSCSVYLGNDSRISLTLNSTLICLMTSSYYKDSIHSKVFLNMCEAGRIMALINIMDNCCGISCAITLLLETN